MFDIIVTLAGGWETEEPHPLPFKQTEGYVYKQEGYGSRRQPTRQGVSTLSLGKYCGMRDLLDLGNSG
jgi:hypothetical protein